MVILCYKRNWLFFSGSRNKHVILAKTNIFCYIINPFLPSLFGQDGRILAWFYFCIVIYLGFVLVHDNVKQRTRAISTHFDRANFYSCHPPVVKEKHHASEERICHIKTYRVSKYAQRIEDTLMRVLRNIYVELFPPGEKVHLKIKKLAY